MLPSRQAIHVTIPARAAFLPVVRAAVDRFCGEAGFDEATTGRIVLGIDEALANVIRHAYGGDCRHPIEISLRLDDGDEPAMHVAIRDYGRRVPNSEIRSRELGELRPGGLGVHIIQECMDRVEYHDADGGGTLLILRKRLPDDAPFPLERSHEQTRPHS